MSKYKTSNRGRLFVVSAPSGAGKTTVVQALLKEMKGIVRSVSHTTRLPRPGEKHGIDYYFVSASKFSSMLKKKEFLEWARVYGRQYGTSKKFVEKLLARGKHVILVIEGQGAKTVRRKVRDAVFVVVLPPSIRELKRRITERSGMTKKEIALRLRLARKEIAGMNWYDYVVVNDSVPKAVTALSEIIQAEAHRLPHRRHLLKSLV